MSEWQLIEAAPKDGTDLLLFGRQEGPYSHPNDLPWLVYAVGSWSDLDEAWLEENTAEPIDFEPSHWMRLPEPPALSSDEGER